MENYLSILEESLQKKIAILGEIQEYNNSQHQMFQSGAVELDSFDGLVQEKASLIERVTKLDDGFEILYNKIGEELKNNRQRYKEQIQRLQQLVGQVTEMSVAVQVQEARNKKLIEEYFARERASIRSGRKSSKAVFDYYKNMNMSNVVPPQFIDKKK